MNDTYRPMTTTLTDGWRLRLGAGPVPEDVPRELPATVPGVVHTDLLASGAIPDPYLDTNEHDLQWIGETDASYRTTFDVADSDHERIDIVAEGLDTASTITLNGSLVARTENQHRSYRFDVRSLLRPTGNEIVVEFTAPLQAARDAAGRVGAMPLVGDALPYNAQRKMACNFGWDWGPTLTTCGIWRPIHVHQWSTARIASAIPRVTVAPDGTGRVALRVELEITGDVPLVVEATLVGPDGEAVHASAAVDDSPVVVEGRRTVELDLSVADAQLWWPRGYGDHPLYGLRAAVRTHPGDDAGAHSGGHVELDSWSHDVGFRTVEVRMTPDEVGTPFEFHVNGQYVWAKGANWIPADCFPSRLTRADYVREIQHALDADMNMLRVWGGGLYESDDFYDICNREGVLVWQDFQFACAIYSEADELWNEVEAEARENVARLAPNPSLVLWNGSNENIEGFHHWGFKEKLAEGQAWGGGYYHDLLPRVLAEIDPERAYIPSSPWSPADHGNPRDPDNGPVHSWKVWFSQDYLAYRVSVPRFVAEFGFQGAPNFSTLGAAVHDDPMLPDSPGVLSHEKAIDGNGKLERGWRAHLPAPTTFDDWHFATQLNQVKAISCAVEHFRSHSPRTAGYLVWQLNDCWPATSWSAVDSASRRKPLWYALRSMNAPRLLMLQPRDASVALVVSNDSPDPWTEELRVRRVALDGTELAAQIVALDVAARTTTTLVLDDDVTSSTAPQGELVVVDSAHARRACWYFAEDVDLDLPEPDLETKVSRVDGGYNVEVTARAFAKQIVLNPDRLEPDATVDEILVTLLPSERYEFLVRTTAELDTDSLVRHPVLRLANDLAHPLPQDGAAHFTVPQEGELDPPGTL